MLTLVAAVALPEVPGLAVLLPAPVVGRFALLPGLALGRRSAGLEPKAGGAPEARAVAAGAVGSGESGVLSISTSSEEGSSSGGGI